MLQRGGVRSQRRLAQLAATTRGGGSSAGGAAAAAQPHLSFSSSSTAIAPEREIAKVVSELHSHSASLAPGGLRCAVVATGAGGHFVHALLSEAGASSTLVEAVVPYAVEAQARYLGYTPHNSVHASTVHDFAVTALGRAEQACAAAAATPAASAEGAGGGEVRTLGLAVSAALATNRERRGADRALIACATRRGDGGGDDGDGAPHYVQLYELTLTKGRRDRRGEDEVVSWAMLHALCRAAGVGAPSVAPRFPAALEDALPGGLRTWASPHQPDPIAALREGMVPSVTIHPLGRITCATPFRGAILAGSFNPLHPGHTSLLRAAAAATALPMAFELAITNADKGALRAQEIQKRAHQFAGESTLLLTAAPTFVEKARTLPGCAFVVGADTAERLVMAKYYGDGSIGAMADAFREMAATGNSFIVAGRLSDETGCFVNFDAPQACAAAGIAFAAPMFRSLTEQEFRLDISSSALRAAGTVVPSLE
jgi:nicotinamide mononucleotide (NMN) deamidase PncC